MFTPTISATIRKTHLENESLVADVALENGVILTSVPFLGQGVGFLSPKEGDEVLLLYQGNSLPYVLGLTNGGDAPLLREAEESAASAESDYTPGHFEDILLQRDGSRVSLGSKGGATIEAAEGQHIRLQLPSASSLRISSNGSAEERLLNAQEFIDPLFELLTQMAEKITALEAALVAAGIVPPDAVQAAAFTTAMDILTALPSPNPAEAQTSCEAAKNPVIKVPSN